MTDKQIKLVRKHLPPRTQVSWNEWTEEEKLISRELDCRDIINSILCYDGVDNVLQNIYLQKYIDELGLNIVVRLVEEQISDFEKAIVKRNIHTDSEGISYNSIIWADEQ